MGLRQRLQKSLGHRVWYGLTHDNHMGQVQWGQGVGQPQPVRLSPYVEATGRINEIMRVLTRYVMA